MSAGSPGDDLAMLEPADAGEWRAWLEANHDTAPGVWVSIGRVGHAATALTYTQAVEEALCFGWIDGTGRRLDETRFRQRFTPRKKGSHWARSNKERVARLTAEGRMEPAGLAAIERAKADGSWGLLDLVEALEIPDDLALALDEAGAAAAFDALTISQRKLALYWVVSAKREATRRERVAETVRAALAGHAPRE